MSVRCITQVWEKSAHAGSVLLILLALADYSDDDGYSFPAISTLARKCRMTPRNVNFILLALQASGELRIFKNEGPNGVNRYRINLAALGTSAPLKPTSPLKGIAPLKPTSPLKGIAPLKSTSPLKRASPPP